MRRPCLRALLDNAASHTPACIACWIGLQIIRLRVNDHGAADDAVGRGFVNGDAADRHIDGRRAVIVELDVAKIARVAGAGCAVL